MQGRARVEGRLPGRKKSAVGRLIAEEGGERRQKEQAKEQKVDWRAGKKQRGAE